MLELVLAALLVFGVSSTLQAQQGEEAEAEEGKNHVAIFLGAATNTDTDDTSFALGADYERRLNQLWGVGLIAEVALGDLERDALLVLPLFLHPTPQIRLTGAAGVEFKRLFSKGDGDETENEVDFAVRLGAVYEFEVGSYSVAPEFDVDFVGGDEIVLVYGVGFGLIF